MPEKGLDAYLEEIKGFKPLPSEEEVELAKKIKVGDKIALGKLVNANLKFVVTIAKKYQGKGLSLRELISEGNSGLIKAAYRFDETRGFKFISYAVWWIRHAILQALIDNYGLGTKMTRRITVRLKINRVIDKLEQKFLREPTIEEIANALNVKKAKTIEMRLISFNRIIFIDEILGQDEEWSNSEKVSLAAFRNELLLDAELIAKSNTALIESILNKLLKKIEGEVVRCYYGIGRKELNYEQIAEEFNLNLSVVRDIYATAINKLRYYKTSIPLKKFFYNDCQYN